jgi:hypothetical protein
MKNIDVIKAFLNGKPAASKNLRTTGSVLMSYKTVIAIRDYDKKNNFPSVASKLIHLDMAKFSKTTSIIQDSLLKEAGMYGIKTIFLKNVGKFGQSVSDLYDAPMGLKMNYLKVKKDLLTKVL